MSLLTNTTGDISTMVAELLFVLCKENVGRYNDQQSAVEKHDSHKSPYPSLQADQAHWLWKCCRPSSEERAHGWGQVGKLGN